MPFYFYIAMGFLAALGLLINPVSIFLIQKLFLKWKETCPSCGSLRNCYPVQKNGPETGMRSTVIETECEKCGVKSDPNYLAHRPF